MHPSQRGLFLVLESNFDDLLILISGGAQTVLFHDGRYLAQYGSGLAIGLKSINEIQPSAYKALSPRDTSHIPYHEDITDQNCG